MVVRSIAQWWKLICRDGTWHDLSLSLSVCVCVCTRMHALAEILPLFRPLWVNWRSSLVPSMNATYLNMWRHRLHFHITNYWRSYVWHIYLVSSSRSVYTGLMEILLLHSCLLCINFALSPFGFFSFVNLLVSSGQGQVCSINLFIMFLVSFFLSLFGFAMAIWSDQSWYNVPFLFCLVHFYCAIFFLVTWICPWTDDDYEPHGWIG